jgi:ATP-dependent Clp protease ATP-binding subunit ClpA
MSEDVRRRSSTSIRSEDPTMLERFTHRARRVVVLAQEEARTLYHDYIGTEHILLGLIHEGEGIAARAFGSLNISLEAVLQKVEQMIGRGQAAPTGHIPFTPRAKKVLELSFRESRQLGHNYIGTEHILLGLIHEGEGVAAEVLQKLGASLTSVRQAVIRLLSGSPAGKYGDPLSPSRFEEREKVLLSFLINEGLSASELAVSLGISEEKVGEIVRAVIEKLKNI